jgi:hypothetical protein
MPYTKTDMQYVTYFQTNKVRLSIQKKMRFRLDPI